MTTEGSASGIITFISDFGLKDTYAGSMKGVILGINPHAVMVDITHEIPAHNVLNAAFALLSSYRYFPKGTVHMAVVDPGVGGTRKNIAVRTADYYFVGPDNGIFTLILEQEKNFEIREIDNPEFMLPDISDTFHGRDVFAPCAAVLAKGNEFRETGRVIETTATLDYPHSSIMGNNLRGEVIALDTFGNMITNIQRPDFEGFVKDHSYEIYFGPERFGRVMRTYSDVPYGAPLVLFGSTGYLEISMNGGNASTYFMSSTGSQILVRRF